MPSTILIVDDERDLLHALDYNLKREGFQTATAENGQEAYQYLQKNSNVQLIILDLMLPDVSGTEICRFLKSQDITKQIPVLMLTARGEEVDRVVGFEMGADDYVVKPFSVRELLLRIRAILRRSEEKTIDDPKQIMLFGNLRVDPVAHRVHVSNEEIALTALEFRLLTTFLGRKGRVQTRDTLLSDVWGIHAEVTTRTVDTHVKRLRKKLGSIGGCIETLRGVGYRFTAFPEQESQPHC